MPPKLSHNSSFAELARALSDAEENTPGDNATRNRLARLISLKLALHHAEDDERRMLKTAILVVRHLTDKISARAVDPSSAAKRRSRGSDDSDGEQTIDDVPEVGLQGDAPPSTDDLADKGIGELKEILANEANQFDLVAAGRYISQGSSSPSTGQGESNMVLSSFTGKSIELPSAVVLKFLYNTVFQFDKPEEASPELSDSQKSSLIFQWNAIAGKPDIKTKFGRTAENICSYKLYFTDKNLLTLAGATVKFTDALFKDFSVAKMIRSLVHFHHKDSNMNTLHDFSPAQAPFISTCVTPLWNELIHAKSKEGSPIFPPDTLKKILTFCGKIAVEADPDKFVQLRQDVPDRSALSKIFKFSIALQQTLQVTSRYNSHNADTIADVKSAPFGALFNATKNYLSKCILARFDETGLSDTVKARPADSVMAAVQVGFDDDDIQVAEVPQTGNNNNSGRNNTVSRGNGAPSQSGGNQTQTVLGKPLLHVAAANKAVSAPVRAGSYGGDFAGFAEVRFHSSHYMKKEFFQTRVVCTFNHLVLTQFDKKGNQWTGCPGCIYCLLKAKDRNTVNHSEQACPVYTLVQSGERDTRNKPIWVISKK